jgi:ABC-type Fe3+-hydroxamate transport system substrate-binding protein
MPISIKTQVTDTLRYNLNINNMLTLFRLILLASLIHSAIFCSFVHAGEKETVFKRIISLYPAHTENLTALGLTQELIGIAGSDTYPPEILSKQRFSHHDNAEKFIAARPDLVLIRPMIARAAPQLLDHLKSAGITIFSLQPRTIDEMFVYWTELGRLTGKDEAARQMISEFKAELKKNYNIIKMIPLEDRPKVYFEAIHSKMKTFSPASIAIFVLEQAGGRNIATDARARKKSNIAAYGKERILSHASEIDIFLAQQGRMNRISIKEIAQEPGFQAIKAIREGKTFLVDEELVSRPTQRILEGIHSIKQILYPQHSSE